MQTFLALYLACAAVVLLNVLIAMLSQTFSSIQSDQSMEFMFGRANMTWFEPVYIPVSISF